MEVSIPLVAAGQEDFPWKYKEETTVQDILNLLKIHENQENGRKLWSLYEIVVALTKFKYINRANFRQTLIMKLKFLFETEETVRTYPGMIDAYCCLFKKIKETYTQDQLNEAEDYMNYIYLIQFLDEYNN